MIIQALMDLAGNNGLLGLSLIFLPGVLLGLIIMFLNYQIN